MVRRNVKPGMYERMTGVVAIAVVAGFATALHARQERRPPAPERQPADQPPAAQAQAPQVDEKSRAVLDGVAKFYKSVDRMKVIASMAVEMPGQEAESPMTLSMAAERPNKFAVPAGEGNQDYRFISDGEKLYQYIAQPVNKYSEDPAPEDFSKLANSGMFAAGGMGTDLTSMANAPHMVVMYLLEGKPLTEVKGVMGVEHIGSEEVDGTAHEHIRLVGDEADVDMWFAAGAEPWLAQVRPDMTKTFEQYGDMGEQLKASMPKVTVSFTDWQQDPELPAETFAFTPPDGAEEVDSLMDAMREAMGGGGQNGEEGRAHALLLGNKAPEVNVDLLGGGTADLARHKDQVVVLDFWATWCGPCVRAMPILTKVTDQYKDKGVVFYAVNVNEDTETVQKFMDKRKFTMKVPMDTDGSVSKRYGVNGIPQTVLIGKDGTVQAVHVGFSPDLEQRLTEELDKLVKGEKLHKE